MAITTYTELKAAVASWLHRDDLTTQIPDFITLGESRINRALASRLGEVDLALTATIGSRYIALPAGFISAYGLWLTTYQPRAEVIYVIPENLVVSVTHSNPNYYSIDGSNLAFNCPADIAYTYTLRYKAGYSIASTSTNNILTNWPDLYLYASLLDAAIYVRDDQRIALWQGLYTTALQEVQIAETANKGLATLGTDSALRTSSHAHILSES